MTFEEYFNRNAGLQIEIDKLKREYISKKLGMAAYQREAKALRLKNNKLERQLFKAIKALEFYASENAYDQVEDTYTDLRFALIEEDEHMVSDREGFRVNTPGKLAKQTLKEIRGEK